MSFTLKQLTEGIRQRHMGAQHQRLTEKWNRTGLLRGLQDQSRENMAVLLENQAAQLLREQNTLGASGQASGDIRGFQNIAFPIVRRVFGGLVANELVSIQPMSLPSGLLFYLDYTYGNNQGGDNTDDSSGNPAQQFDSDDAATYASGTSIYNNPTGKSVQAGSFAAGGQYDLAGSGYSRRHDVASGLSSVESTSNAEAVEFGIINQAGKWEKGNIITSATQLTGASGRFMQFDPQVQTALENGDIAHVQFAKIPVSFLTSSVSNSNLAADLTLIKDVAITADDSSAMQTTNVHLPDVVPQTFQGGRGIRNLRRLNQLVTVSSAGVVAAAPLATTSTDRAHVLCTLIGTGSDSRGTSGALATTNSINVSFVLGSALDVGTGVGDALTIPAFESDFGPSGLGYQPSPVIPEIDIKIESLAVTAVTRKLRARWSPELAQDLNAYHSLDAEVELTQILSEQIALELDREILNDLLTQANGANFFWSRAPGKFVNKETGAAANKASSLAGGPAFTGTVREWYETLTETIIDCANTIHRKTLRGSANFIVVGPDVATILESSVLYKPVYSLDGDGQVGAGMSIGAEKVGSLSNRFTVYKDPYFPRNKILIGYKGGSYLETGYVYAPYVPLIVTPTIFAPEDFTPRKGVMTRYGKKMVRSDFYGTVTCMDMNII